MPKAKSSLNSLLKDWIKDKQCFSTDGTVVLCKVCEKSIGCSKKFHIEQHENTAIHKKQLALKNNSRQQLLTNMQPTGSDPFYKDLSQAMIAANIPWKTLSNSTFRSFLEKYCKRNIPQESTLRKNYLEKCYSGAIERIRNDVGSSYIWIAVDETTDTKGRYIVLYCTIQYIRYIANMIVGKMSDTGPSFPHLLASKQLEKTNHATIARFVNDSLGILWPTKVEHERVRMLLSDGAAYMVKAGAALKVFYPHLLHVTCIAHALNRVCEQIRENYPEVNKLISNTKKVFLKAPFRIQQYKEQLPNTPLPPEPVVTRWGTWLQAVFFYQTNFEDVKKVVQTFNTAEAKAINIAKQCFEDRAIQASLVYITSNFKILADSITKLESAGLSLIDSFQILEEVKDSLKQTNVADKLKYVLNKNPDLGVVSKMSKILSGESKEVDVDVNVSDLTKYKYVPLTSVDVERSFSMYKYILSDRRHNFTESNLEQVLVTYCEGKFSS